MRRVLLAVLAAALTAGCGGNDQPSGAPLAGLFRPGYFTPPAKAASGGSEQVLTPGRPALASCGLTRGDGWSLVSGPRDIAASVRVDDGYVVASRTNGLWHIGLDGRTQYVDAPITNLTGLVARGSLYVVWGEQGLFTTHDGGFHWEAAAGRLKGPGELFMDEAGGTAIFAWSDAGLMRSDDAGLSFQRVNLGGLQAPVTSLRQQGSTRLLAAVSGGEVFLSRDGGRSFEPLRAEALTQVTDVAFDLAEPRRWFAAATDGIEGRMLVSDDDGQTWRIAGRGHPRDLRYLVPVPSSDMLLAVTAGGEVLQSSDGGVTFTAPGSRVPAGRMPRVSGGEIVVDGLATADGTTFRPLHTELPAFDGRAVVAAAPGQPSRLLVGGQQVFGTEDFGCTWVRRGVGAELLAFAPSDASVLYRVEHELLGVSTDGGASWTSLGQRLTSPQRTGTGPSLAISPLSATSLALVRGGTVVVSTDGGSFTDLGVVSNARQVAYAADGSQLYTLLEDGRVAVLRDGALAFEPVLLSAAPVPTVLVADRSDAQTAYAASRSVLYVTRDGGRTWTPNVRTALGGSAGALGFAPALLAGPLAGQLFLGHDVLSDFGASAAAVPGGMNVVAASGGEQPVWLGTYGGMLFMRDASAR